MDEQKIVRLGPQIVERFRDLREDVRRALREAEDQPAAQPAAPPVLNFYGPVTIVIGRAEEDRPV